VVVEDSFLKSYDRKRLIWYMGSEQQIAVKKEVEVIGEYCFFNLLSLREVIFEEGSTLRSIEDSAFAGCKLGKMVFPASLETIGEEAFANCIALREVTYEGEVPVIGRNAFSNCRL
jgi:hypothetical protein